MAAIHRRYRKNKKKRNPSGDSSSKKNPTTLADIGEWVVPGFASFAAVRFGTRVASQVVAKKKPSLGKHAGALTSAGAFFAVWLLAHRVKWLKDRHTPIVVGAAIAAIQSIIQIYIPRLGWMLADASPELQAGAAAAPEQAMGSIPDGFEFVDEDPSAYTYNDRYDPGRYGTSTQHAQHEAPSAGGHGPFTGATGASGDDLIDEEIEQMMGVH